MRKPLNRIFSGVPAGKSTSRGMRRRLALTTILAVSPFLNYGRPTYAACVSSPPSNYACGGTFPSGHSITANNANVTTEPGLVVTDGGFSVDGLGLIQFTDYNASSITNTGGPGLSVTSQGGASGGVKIITDGTIQGINGIRAENLGSEDIDITVDGVVTGLNSDGVLSPGSDGIKAINWGDDLRITTGAGSIVTGDDNAIDARNFGDGDLGIKIYGDAVSEDFDGVYAVNEGINLSITTGAQSLVNGNGDGIVALNYGSGYLNVSAYGQVVSRNYDGIRAVNEGYGLTITTGPQSLVTGADNGIDARNVGGGDLVITANGDVTGFGNDAIFARNEGGNLSITTAANTRIRGSGNGIGAYNFGDGDLDIIARGLVGGYSEDTDGIHAYNSDNSGFGSEDGGNLTITAEAGSDVFGGKDGIDARNFGFGFLQITAEGVVTGKDGAGINALNVIGKYRVGGEYPDYEYAYGGGTNLTIVTGAQSTVTGYSYGIRARNYGNGNLSITADGDVAGQNYDGIFALDGSEGNNVTIITGVTSAVAGYDDGIDATNNGYGSMYITVNGTASGQRSDGIEARSYKNSLIIETGAGSVVTGVGDDGIDADNYGSGEFKITAAGVVTGNGAFGDGIAARNIFGGETIIGVKGTGLVQGRYSAIDVRGGGGLISITNDGLVRNLSAESDARAIVASGGAAHIDNNGDLVGFVKLDVNVYDDVLDNDGFWNTAKGTNDFGGGSEDEVNNTGTLVAADDPDDGETTKFDNLETFNNSGWVSLVDGQNGDSLELNGATQYEGEDGSLAVDAVLGPDGKSDQLIVSGDISGTSKLFVNVVSATGRNDEGIPVILAATTDASDFELGAPVNGGFFTWGLRIDDGGEMWHELYTTGTGAGSFEFPAGLGGAQDLWQQTSGTLAQRQADLRALFEGVGVTPVADFGEPVAATPVARVTPGFWFSGLGAYVERDDEAGGFVLDRKQTIWGGMAGFDFGTQSVGDALMFGVFGGYLTSKLDFKETNSEWTYEGPSAGVYATYLDRAFFADVTVKVDFLDIDIDPADLGAGSDGNTDALNIGGRIDTGYKFGESVFLEPQASLAVVHTEIDDVDIFGGTVEFDDETSVRGRLGMRLGFDHTAENSLVYSGDVTAGAWEDFSGDNDVTIATPGQPSFGVSDDAGGTMGDVSLGFSVASPEGWSSFIRGNYQFAQDYDAYSGNAGLRYAW